MSDEQPCSDRHGAAETAGQPVAWMNPSIEPPMFIAHWAKMDHGAVFANGGYTAAYTIPLYVAPAAPAGEPPPLTTDRIDRLKDAIEGECDGLAIDDAHAKAILEYLDTENVKEALIPAPAGEPLTDAQLWSAYADGRADEAEEGDAARYRWLRANAYETVIPHGGKLAGKRTAWITHLLPGATFDDAVDAARAPVPAAAPAERDDMLARHFPLVAALEAAVRGTR